MTDLVLTDRAALALIDQMEVAVAEVDSPAEADELWRKVRVIEHAARLAGISDSKIVRMARVRLRLHRRWGELLGEAKHGGTSGNTNASKNGVTVGHAVSEPAERKTTQRARQVYAVPEEDFEAFVAQDEPDKLSTAGLLATTKKRQRAESRQRRDEREQERPGGELLLLECPVADLPQHHDAGTVDLILTDPPYPREFLGVYEQLSHTAAILLKDGGLLAAMVGQSYLPDVIAALDKHLDYHWTLAHLTPGGQAVQLWERNVNTFYKPVLIYRKGDYAGAWFGDVTRSDVNDNDKRYHHWGQSESGMADLVKRLSAPDALVCDPFVGGGATAIAALRYGRRFLGADVDPAALKTCRDRLA